MQTIQEFCEGLDRLSQLDYEPEVWKGTIGFVPNSTRESVQVMFQRGRWDLLVFRYKNYSHADGIRIMPDKPFTEWPVYCILKSRNTILELPSVRSYIARQIHSRLSWSAGGLESFAFHKNKRAEIFDEVFPVFGGRASAERELAYFLDKGDNISYKQGIRQDRLMEFWKQENTFERFDDYLDLIDKMRDDRQWIPKITDGEFGIYQNRIYNILAHRVGGQIVRKWVRLDPDGKKKRLKQEDSRYVWKAFCSVHGYDMATDPPTTGMYPENPQYIGYSEDLITFWNMFDEDIEQHPLYEAARALEDRGERYNGKEHMIAAAILDEQYNDPIAAFNALAAGSYWAGKNQPQSIPLIAKQALVLCEQNNWYDAVYAIEYQMRKYE